MCLDGGVHTSLDDVTSCLLRPEPLPHNAARANLPGPRVCPDVLGRPELELGRLTPAEGLTCELVASLDGVLTKLIIENSVQAVLGRTPVYLGSIHASKLGQSR